MSTLNFYFGAMSAGKTTLLLQAAYNYAQRGMPTRLFTAQIDDRCGVGRIQSRIGLEQEAEIYTAQTVFDIATIGPNTRAVFIEESQFLAPVQAHQLHRLAHLHGIPVTCYGLRSDFLGRPFAGACTLLTLADAITEVKTVCGCGANASMNARFDNNGQRVQSGHQILIGGNDRYTSMCPLCFYRGIDHPAPVPTGLAQALAQTA